MTRPTPRSGMHKGECKPRPPKSDPLSAAIRHLESAICSARSATPGLFATRLNRVRRELEAHERITEGPDGMLADVVQRNPHLTRRADRLRHEHDDLHRRLESLRFALSNVDDARWALLDALRLLAELRHHHAEGNGLAFDAYLTDGGAGD